MKKWFKKENRELRKVFKAKTFVTAFAIIAVVLVTSISMADWVVEDDGTADAIYVDNNTGYVGINPTPELISSGFQAALHVHGGIYVEVGHNFLGKSIQVGTSYDSNRRGIYLDNGSATSWDQFTLKNNNGTHFIVNSYGRVGIGTGTPQYKLQVNGMIKADQGALIDGTTTSTNYACSSDVRYKKDISPYQNALEKVLGLRGVNYFWRADEFKDNNFSKDKQIGFIAQEVEKVIPELVYTDDKGYKTMSYDRLTAVLVEAVKELKSQSDAKISALEKESNIKIISLEKESNKKINALELENATLKQKLAKLESMVTTLEKVVVQNKLSPEQRNGKQKKLAVK